MRSAQHASSSGKQRASTPAAALPGASARPRRIAGIDALRGTAVVLMVAYHFCFDLRHFGFTAWDFYRDPFWLHARTLILSSFLLLAGVSLVLAESTAPGRARFWRHVVRIAACALVVTAASYVVFPRSTIWFGVLHAIALSLLLIRPLATRPRLALILGLAVIVAGSTLSSPFFDNVAWGWVGFMTHKPVTEDYVPLFPWTGVMLVGIALGHALGSPALRSTIDKAAPPALLPWLGRHSLPVYMVHQPLLFGAVYLAAAAWSR